MADPKLKINLNRGVVLRKDPITKIEVYMYKDEPGIYLTPQGKLIPNDIAARAGYPVEELEKKRVKKEKLAEFMQNLETEMGSTDDNPVEAEQGGYKLVKVGSSGMAVIKDEEGNSLVAMPLPMEIAKELFEKLAGPIVKSKKAGVKSLADD